MAAVPSRRRLRHRDGQRGPRRRPGVRRGAERSAPRRHRERQPRGDPGAARLQQRGAERLEQRVAGLCRGQGPGPARRPAPRAREGLWVLNDCRRVSGLDGGDPHTPGPAGAWSRVCSVSCSPRCCRRRPSPSLPRPTARRRAPLMKRRRREARRQGTSAARPQGSYQAAHAVMAQVPTTGLSRVARAQVEEGAAHRSACEHGCSTGRAPRQGRERAGPPRPGPRGGGRPGAEARRSHPVGHHHGGGPQRRRGGAGGRRARAPGARSASPARRTPART